MMEEILKNNFIRQNSVPFLSFVIGTFIMILYSLFKFQIFIIIGLYFVFGALITNTVYIMVLLNLHFIKKRRIQETLLRIVITLLNIPITLFYIYLIVTIIH